MAMNRDRWAALVVLAGVLFLIAVIAGVVW
jgi:hypothetical protein